MDLQVIRRLSFQGSSSGLDKVANELETISTAEDRVTATSGAMAEAEARAGQAAQATITVHERQATATLRAGQALDRLRTQIDDQFRAEQRIAAGRRLLDVGMSQGLIGNDEYALRLAQLNQKYRKRNPSEEPTPEAPSGGLNRMQMLETAHVARALADSLAAGQSPMRAFAMEGARIGQIFSMGEGGIGTQLANMGRSALGLLAPLASVTGASLTLAAAVGGTLAVSYYRHEEALKQMDSALVGVGRSVGVTAQSLLTLANTSATAGHVTSGEARDMAAAYASTGRLGTSMIAGLIGVTKNYAATIGVDMADATKTLASAFSDPVKGADALNERLGFLSDKTREAIDQAAKHGNTLTAQKTLLDALSPALVDAADRTSRFARAWEAVAHAASGAADSIGSALGKASPAAAYSSLAALRGQILDGQGPAVGGAHTGKPIDPALAARWKDAEAGWGGKSMLPAIDTQMDDLREQMRFDAMRLKGQADSVIANRLSLEGGGIARKVLPGVEDYEGLKAQRDTLGRVLSNPLAASRLADITAAKEAYERLTNAVKTLTDANGQYIGPAQRKIEVQRIEAEIAKTKDPATRASLARRKEELSLAGQLLTGSERQGLIQSAGDIAGNKAAAHEKKDPFATSLISFEKQTQFIRDQEAAIGKTADFLAREKAITELTAEAKKAYGTVTDAVREKIEREADARQIAEESLTRHKRAYDGLNQAESYFASSLTEGIGGLLGRTTTAEQAIQRLTQSLLQATVQAALMGSGPLAGIFGAQPAVPGQTGGIFGALFSGFKGMFAEGGSIGAGSWGIAGEAGPEIIKGPASVTPWDKIGGGGASGAPVYNASVALHYNGGGSAGPDVDKGHAEALALQMRTALDAHAAEFTRRQMRPGGLLATSRPGLPA